MSPPPSTPAPRKFLPAKRSTQLSQSFGGSQQFHSTPRFGSSSVSRPPRKAEQEIEEVEEEVASTYSSNDKLDEDPEDAFGWQQTQHNRLDIESDPLHLTQDSLHDRGLDHSIVLEESSPDRVRTEEPFTPSRRLVKRRKLSTASGHSSSLRGQEDEHHLDTEEHNLPDNAQDYDTGSELGIDADRTARSFNQPTFQSAPRFRRSEADELADWLPAAFSPQRRGAKYLPEGLAAELQGWLSEVKGWDGFDAPAAAVAASFTVVVEEVRPGTRMYLARAHMANQDGGEMKRLILAGEGALTGLERRAEVVVGSEVLVMQPVWDVELEGETWITACDWRVT